VSKRSRPRPALFDDLSFIIRSPDMRILVTNDDGIHSEGLDICAEIGRGACRMDVWVIAPEFDQSGVSHSLLAQ